MANLPILDPGQATRVSPQVQTFDKGHGRIEVRRIRLSDDLADYLDFPHARVVFRFERETSKLDGSSPRREVVYGVRSVTFNEDRSQVRKRACP